MSANIITENKYFINTIRKDLMLIFLFIMFISRLHAATDISCSTSLPEHSIIEIALPKLPEHLTSPKSALIHTGLPQETNSLITELVEPKIKEELSLSTAQILEQFLPQAFNYIQYASITTPTYKKLSEVHLHLLDKLHLPRFVQTKKKSLGFDLAGVHQFHHASFNSYFTPYAE